MAKLNIRNQQGIPEISFSGVDIQAFVNIPLLNIPDDENPTNPTKGLLGQIQTISLSSTRSISPVRTLGRSSPLGYTRGARTIAGTLVFAVLDRDPFFDIYRSSITESYDGSSSLFADRLPPFSILITASNELGGIAQQVISGITLVNYGTTYSIDDIYTETTYSYVATSVTPLLPTSELIKLKSQQSYKTPYSLLDEHYSTAYGTVRGNTPNSNHYTITDISTSYIAESAANFLGLSDSRFWRDTVSQLSKDEALRKNPGKIIYYSTVMG